MARYWPIQEKPIRQTREFKAANKRGAVVIARGPVARAARYDARRALIIISLEGGCEFSFPDGIGARIGGCTAFKPGKMEIGPNGHLHIREQLSTIVDTPHRCDASGISCNQRLSRARFAREVGMADAMSPPQKRRDCDVKETSVVSRISLFNLVPAAFLTLSMAAAAYGADSGFYLGADLGHSDHPANVKLTVDSSTLASDNLSYHDLGWGITGGYQFNRYLAVEAGYLDLGRLSGPLTNIAGTSAASGRFDLSVRGATQAVVGILPFGNWEAYLKLGYFYSDVRLSLSGVSGAGPFNHRASVSDLSEWGGLGLRYRLAQHWQVNVEYDRYGSFGDRGKTGTYTNRTPSVGFAYRF